MAKKTLAEKMAENSRTVYDGMKTNTIGNFSSTEIIKKNIIVLDQLKDLIPPLLESNSARWTFCPFGKILLICKDFKLSKTSFFSVLYLNPLK